jgi:hypothetical protein
MHLIMHLVVLFVIVLIITNTNQRARDRTKGCDQIIGQLPEEPQTPILRQIFDGG